MTFRSLLALIVAIGLLSCADDNPVETDVLGAFTYGSKTYHPVAIGGQVWLKENLDIGSRVPALTAPSDDGVIQKYCYDDDSAKCAAYGGLYRWAEVMKYDTTAGAQGICPPGWHVPTLADFNVLISTVHSNGNALKAVGRGAGAGAGTDGSGFSALLGGYAPYSPAFSGFGTREYFWASSGGSAAFAWAVNVNGADTVIESFNDYELNAFNVRCIRN